MTQRLKGVRRVSTTVAAVMALALLTTAGVAALSASGLVVFGTSLSDTGNAFTLLGTKSTNTPPDYDVDAFLVPNSPYAKGGLHLTNGATWVEQLARPIGLEASVKPAFRGSGAKAANYAVGGARSYNDAQSFNLVRQVAAFLADSGGSAPAGNIYVIEMGSNDVRDALVAYQAGQNGGAILTAAIQSITQQITALYARGARDFLVWNVPDIGLTPAVQSRGAGAVAFASQLTVAFNASLGSGLDQLSQLPGIHIRRLDVFTLIHQVAASPFSFGLTNASDACITPGVAPFACHKPDDYLFWDGVHPTTAGHAIIANLAASLLAP